MLRRETAHCLVAGPHGAVRDLTNGATAPPFRRMSAILLLSNFSSYGTAGVRGGFDVALR